MVKWGIILIGGIVALSLTGLGFTQEKAKPAEGIKVEELETPAEPAEPAKVAEPAKEVKKEAPKVLRFRAGGLVTALDLPGKKIKIKQDKVKRERELKLRVSKKASKDLDEIKVGDVVNVWGRGNTVTTLEKVY
jgi:hypothetical protein